MNTRLIPIFFFVFANVQSQDLDSLFYFLTKQTIGESDKIVVNGKARIPTAIWDADWNRMKENGYFETKDSDFVKSQIQNQAISRWNRKRLNGTRVEIPPDETVGSDEAITFTKSYSGKTTYFIDLPLMSADKSKVVISYRLKNAGLGPIGEFVTVWTLNNNAWAIKGSGMTGLH